MSFKNVNKELYFFSPIIANPFNVCIEINPASCTYRNRYRSVCRDYYESPVVSTCMEYTLETVKGVSRHLTVSRHNSAFRNHPIRSLTFKK